MLGTAVMLALPINRGFGGALRNDASLDFALAQQANARLGAYKKLASLWRAILVDHPFTDGNKRTAAFVAFAFADEHHKTVDHDRLVHHIVAVATQNITSIRRIERRLRHAIE